jgi:transcriptional regulator with XRE-family HTH domain
LAAYPHSPRWKLMCRRLRDARERSGLKQIDAAAALGKPQNFVSKCETGQRRIDPIELADFAALYGTTLDALVPTDAAGRGERPKRVAEPTVKPRRKEKRRREGS